MNLLPDKYADNEGAFAWELPSAGSSGINSADRSVKNLRSAKITITSTGAKYIEMAAADRFPVEPSTRYLFRGNVYAIFASGLADSTTDTWWFVQWYTSGGVFISQSNPTSGAKIIGNRWSTHAGVTTSPANAGLARIGYFPNILEGPTWLPAEIYLDDLSFTRDTESSNLLLLKQ